MISAILLSAGESKRMGRPKALLEFGDQTFLRRALETLKKSQVDEIILVTGAHRPEVEIEAERCMGPLKKFGGASEAVDSSKNFNKKFKIIWNQRWSEGMLTSIQAGVERLSPQSRAFFVSLVDLPFVESKDYNDLVEIFHKANPMLSRFRYQGSATHPVLIGKQFCNEILKAPVSDQGCGFLFKKYANSVLWLEAATPRGLIDIDTGEDYRAHLSP